MTALFRYPGGKAKLAKIILPYAEDISTKGIVEPFCGGASVAILYAKKNPKSKIILNDLNPKMFIFWNEVIKNYVDLAKRVKAYKPSVDSFMKMKLSDDALSTIVVNRCSHSGRGGGPIGGMDQSGQWKIDARWNADSLAKEILIIGELLKGRCSVKNTDGISLIESSNDDFVIYADPPYVKAGKSLYEVNFTDKMHDNLAYVLRRKNKWVLSYDKHKVVRSNYDDMPHVSKIEVDMISANHSGGSKRQKELLYVKNR